MSSPQPSPRPNFTSIVAACILSGGLITAAIINSHKPAPVFTSGLVAVSGEGRAAHPTPPISKASLSAQVVAQLMAAPEMQNVALKDVVDGYGASVNYDSPLQAAGKSACKLTSVTVDQIEYDAKEDTFVVVISATFRPASGKDIIARDVLSFRNDGYNQYIGEYYLRGTVNHVTGKAPEVHLTIH